VAKLTVLRGRQAGAEVVLDGKPLLDLGSSPGPAGFRLEGPGIAPTHVRIVREEKTYLALDVGGAGFTVNGKKVTRATLNEGDELGIGSVALRFLGLGSSTSGQQAPGQQAPATPPGLSRPADEPVDAPAILYCHEGPDKGRIWPLPDSSIRMVIGRGVTADIVVMDIKCSREHCRLERRNHDYVVVDMSTNGTRVNGTKMAQSSTQALKWGDQIRVGTSTLELRQAGARAPTAKLGSNNETVARPSAPPPPLQVAPIPPPRQPAPLPPPPPPQRQTPAARPIAKAPENLEEVTFDFGAPEKPQLPPKSRSSATDHGDDAAGQEALRTFVFADQPGEFGGSPAPPARPAPPPPAPVAEPPLDDYGLPPLDDYTAPAPPPPPPVKAEKKPAASPPPPPPKGDAALVTFVFDQAPSFDAPPTPLKKPSESKAPEKKPPEPEKKPTPDLKKSDAQLRTFVFDENPTFDAPATPPKKPVEESADAQLRTFVFEETPGFDTSQGKKPPVPEKKPTGAEKKPAEAEKKPAPAEKKPTGAEKKPAPAEKPAEEKKPSPDLKKSDAQLRTFVFDENPSFDTPAAASKKPAPPPPEGTDAQLRTFVFDENPSFDPPAPEKKASEKKPPEKKPAEKKPPEKPPVEDESPDVAMKTLLFGETPEFGAVKESNDPDAAKKPKGGKKPDGEEPPETMRTFVFDKPPDF
jgi:pSer/pThr/pTyr-binding forkhead associated (FHA) protein